MWIIKIFAIFVILLAIDFFYNIWYNKNMNTGISTACMFLRKSTEDAAATIKELGADTAEVFFQTFYEYRPEFSKALAPTVEGLNINSVHVFSNSFEPNVFIPSRRTRGDGFYWLDQIMRSAQLLGCKRYTFHGQSGRHNASHSDYGELAAYLRSAVEFCAGYGVQLCLENVFWSTYNRPGVFRELKSRIPELAGVFDIKQARRSGYPYAMYIEDMSGAISHVHLSDVDENGKMCLPGKGLYDFEEILKRLKGAGFDGSAIIEVYPDDYGDISELRQSLGFLNEIIYKIG